jgi:hypothetical protein
MLAIRIAAALAALILGTGASSADPAGNEPPGVRPSVQAHEGDHVVRGDPDILGVALMDFVAGWLASEFDLPPTEVLPAVVLVPVHQIVSMRYGNSVSSGNADADVAAVYSDGGRTIYVPAGWSGRTPAEFSLLVHEMVHHLQNIAGMTYECPEARERLAYLAQDRWLALTGTSLATEFGIDPMTLLVRTSCFR